ncbi:putative LysM domain protein [Treponema primitia ZAS-2]|uniref:Putative LysM domain protein n=1 Tax=Treponema primitia (strain ATCC BAA-887 / DSM 12427 / ZAS-2) TaxID=545694 RepID=F5YP78_TREPZ|nr:LysM peptidoglycan-binding domain-containing protein [Treponema primitia]AEF83633.1 putative LysM domain protein [Treponema primitia ZAS-2]
MASTIGIKIANGEFYPIMEENSSIKKRLVLTTVHDKQKSVQIDLYNSFAKTMADALYIGTLVVENIKSRPKGEASIEMILSSNSKGEISADAVDLDASSGEHQRLNVSLTSMEEDDPFAEMPDFDLDSQDHPPLGLYDKDSIIHEREQKKRFPWGIFAVICIVVLAVCALLYFFFLTDTGAAVRTGISRRFSSSSTVIPPRSTPAPVAPSSPAPAAPVTQAPVPAASSPPAPQTPAAPVTQTPVPASPTPPASPAAPSVPLISASQQPAQSPAPAAARQTRSGPPVASYKVPQTIPRAGAPYTVRWGDTLWDISEAFYRNPWLYPRIARFNNIRNPDFIISGRTIRIPPRN